MGRDGEMAPSAQEELNPKYRRGEVKDLPGQR